MPEEYRITPAIYDRVSRLYELVAAGSEPTPQYYANCRRFYEAAYTKLPHDVVAELGEKVAQHHPAKTYVRDTIGALLNAGMPEDQVENSLRLLFL